MTTSDELFTAIDADDAERVRSLVEADAALATSRDAEGVSAVMHSLYRGQRPVAEMVAASLTALDVFEAAGLGRTEQVTQLVAQDPGLATAWSADGFTPLHFAAFFGGGGVARALLAAGADPDVRSRNELHVMPIHSAVAGRRAEVVAALLDAGADPGVRQRHGWTPLHGAAQNGDADSVEYLLAAGADPAATNGDGRTAAKLAREAGHLELAARLEARTAQAAPAH